MVDMTATARARRLCPVCGGSGILTKRDPRSGLKIGKERCHHCKGTGYRP